MVWNRGQSYLPAGIPRAATPGLRWGDAGQADGCWEASGLTGTCAPKLQVWRCGVVQSEEEARSVISGGKVGGSRVVLGPACSSQRRQLQYPPRSAPPPPPPHSPYQVTLTLLPTKIVSLSPPCESGQAWATVEVTLCDAMRSQLSRADPASAWLSWEAHSRHLAAMLLGDLSGPQMRRARAACVDGQLTASFTFRRVSAKASGRCRPPALVFPCP